MLLSVYYILSTLFICYLALATAGQVLCLVDCVGCFIAMFVNIATLRENSDSYRYQTFTIHGQRLNDHDVNCGR